MMGSVDGNANIKQDFSNMLRDDLSLPLVMGKLKIEPMKSNKILCEENPFLKSTKKNNKGNLFSKTLPQSKCSFCPNQKVNQSISKKKHRKILKDPVLTILKNVKSKDMIERSELKLSNINKQISTVNVKLNGISLHTLVDNCNQLSISKSKRSTSFKSNFVWWKKDSSLCKQTPKDSSQERVTSGPSCSQQAMNAPCDVTIDELASYFETLVHIPKKMSSMAEMMYI